MKKFLLGFGTCYLAFSLLCGFAMQSAMPALNLLGVAFVGLVSPINIACTAISDFSDGPEPACSVMPGPDDEWAAVLFTFN